MDRSEYFILKLWIFFLWTFSLILSLSRSLSVLRCASFVGIERRVNRWLYHTLSRLDFVNRRDCTTQTKFCIETKCIYAMLSPLIYLHPLVMAACLEISKSDKLFILSTKFELLCRTDHLTFWSIFTPLHADWNTQTHKLFLIFKTRLFILNLLTFKNGLTRT